MDTQQFEIDAENNFQTTKKEQLLQYCETLGIPVKEHYKVRDLKNKLLAQLGKPELVEKAISAAKIIGNVKTGDVEESPVAAKPFATLTLQQLINLNLSPQAKWEGKRMRLILQKQSPTDRYLPVGWSSNVIFIPYEVEVSISVPHYNSLKERFSIKLKQKTMVDEESGSRYMDNKWIKGPGYPFTPLGVDPATAHLPESPREQYRAIAVRTDNFQTIAYPGMKILARKMRVPVPALAPSSSIDDAKEALRWELMRSIGIEPDISEYLTEAVA